MREWLKRIREQKEISQQEVADRLNISRQYYQQIEAGDRQQKMDISLILRLSECFKISVSEIVQNEKEISDNKIGGNT